MFVLQMVNGLHAPLYTLRPRGSLSFSYTTDLAEAELFATSEEALAVLVTRTLNVPDIAGDSRFALVEVEEQPPVRPQLSVVRVL